MDASTTTTTGPSTAGGTRNHAIIFTTQTPYPLPTQKYMIPTTWKRYHLSQLINKALGLAKPVPFDFLVKGEILRESLGEWCSEHGFGEEETLEIEYIESVLPPQRLSEFPHESWVSGISSLVPSHFVTAAYDGHLRAFDTSQNLVLNAPLHSAPITSFSFIPSSTGIFSTASPNGDGDTYKIATSSQDLTAQISEVTFSTGPSANGSAKVLASLHLHTGSVSSIASNGSGTQLLTSSWDGLIGLWDTSIPPSHEVAEPSATTGERKKRRKVDGSGESATAKRKAPLTVLKSHIGRVSSVKWIDEKRGVSCGFDSTVRVWDVESGVCTRTVVASEKPFVQLGLTYSASGTSETALALSTDRTMTLYDLRTSPSALSASIASFLHPSTPSCLSTTEESEWQVVTGAYDGIVRVWDLRSSKGAISSFRAFTSEESKGKGGDRKVLSVDWRKGVVAIGGEGGLDVWKVGVGASA